MTRNIAVTSLKGGTGKTTVTANLGLALAVLGHSVGFMDIDITGANLPSALDLEDPLDYGYDTAAEKIIPYRFGSCEVFSVSTFFGQGAVLWLGGEEEIEYKGKKVRLDGTGRYNLVLQMLRDVRFSNPDFLLFDLPPSSGDEVMSLWDHLGEIWGVLLVGQPTGLALEDTERTLNMIEARGLPVIGMVGNMAAVRCPHCEFQFSPFLDGEADLRGLCESNGVPLLMELPLDADRGRTKDRFLALAARVKAAKPTRIRQRSRRERLEEGLRHTAVKVAIKRWAG